MNTQSRFWAKVDKSGGCWLWTACRDGNGYGWFGIGSKKCGGFRMVRTHRFAWELTNGPIPDSMCVCHRCDIRHCVNPAHLFLGTDADNVHDRDTKGRGAFGEKQGSAKLTEQDVLEIRALAASGQKNVALATRFGVGRRTINNIVLRQRWRHV
jgi:hypothetical protein